MADDTSVTTKQGMQLGLIPASTVMVDKAAVVELIEANVTSAWKAGGSIAPSILEATGESSLLKASNEGKVYNVNGEFTTSASFVEGAGKTYLAGTNVAVINAGDATTPSWKFDVLGGTDSSTVRQIVVGSSTLTPTSGSVTLPAATNGAAGVVTLSDAIDSTSAAANGVAATPKSVKTAYDTLANAKQDNLAFDGAYDASTNKVATVSTVTGAINALGGEATSADSTNVQVKVTTEHGAVKAVSITTDNTENKKNKVSSFQETPDDTHYPTEKLVKDSLDAKANKNELTISDVAGDSTKKTIQLKSGVSADVVVEHQNVTGKADKVSGATADNFAALDANGNLKDSGHKHDDYKTKQTAVPDPTAGSASTTEFIATITQDANGVITATKQPVAAASATQNGLMSSEDFSKLAALPTNANLQEALNAKLAIATFVNAMNGLTALATDGTVTMNDILGKVNTIVAALKSITAV